MCVCVGMRSDQAFAVCQVVKDLLEMVQKLSLRDTDQVFFSNPNGKHPWHRFQQVILETSLKSLKVTLNHFETHQRFYYDTPENRVWKPY